MAQHTSWRGQLERLEHLRQLLPADTVAAQPRLLLFASNGFTDELVRASRSRPDVELIDPDRLYHGS